MIHLSSARTTLRTRGLLAAAAALALSVSVAYPAAAATTGGTPATLTVEGGVLAISVPTATAHLGTVADSVSGSTVSGSLGEVVVTDARKAAAGSGWVATVISTAFTPFEVTPATAIPAAAVSYTAGAIAKVGTAAFTANNPGNLTGVAPAVTATGITGNKSATWSPTITVAVPGGAVNALYTATVTHSVL